MDKIFFRTLFEYTFWTDRQVWDCILTLTDEQFDEPLDYSIGSIRNHCAHMMSVEYWWLYFLEHGELPDFNALQVYFDKATPRSVIRERWDEVEKGVLAYIDTLTPEELQREVKPPFWDDGKRPVRAWEGLLQVAYHSTDHRAQILAGLHRLGAKTIGQDYLNFKDTMPLPPLS